MAVPAAPVPTPLRLESITLRAYRAFSAEQEIKIGGRNLIVYGENGAGKSSIYKALRDLFARRPLASAMTNGAHVHPLDASIVPTVGVSFTDNTPAVQWTQARHPGQTPADPRIATAALRSSFLDYHALLETNAFHCAQRPNLFSLAVGTLLSDFVTATESRSIDVLWRLIEKPDRHKASMSHLTRVEKACSDFNAALQAALDAMTPIVNTLLADLGQKQLVINRFERGTVRYNNARLKKERGFDGRELFADIEFRGYQPQTPQHFFNEARLSALALAFYLAGRLASVPSAPSTALKLLVLDDVLVGLDYGNRRPLLDVLATHFSDWQIILLTHDRHWFEIVRASIPSDRWTCHEMYEMVAATGEATPLVRPVATNIVQATLDQASIFLTQKHMPAAANYARSACELLLRDYCFKKRVEFPYQRDPRKLSFDKMKNAIALKVAGVPAQRDALAAITPFQARILNPLSHDPTTPLNEAEVRAAIDAVGILITALR